MLLWCYWISKKFNWQWPVHIHRLSVDINSPIHFTSLRPSTLFSLISFYTRYFVFIIPRSPSIAFSLFHSTFKTRLFRKTLRHQATLMIPQPPHWLRKTLTVFLRICYAISFFLIFWFFFVNPFSFDILRCTKRSAAENTFNTITSHAGTVVPECFKDDNASQWKSGKFDPRSLTNHWTDRHQNLHGWLRRGPLPLCKILSRYYYPPLPPKYAKMRIKWLG